MNEKKKIESVQKPVYIICENFHPYVDHKMERILVVHMVCGTTYTTKFVFLILLKYI